MRGGLARPVQRVFFRTVFNEDHQYSAGGYELDEPVIELGLPLDKECIIEFEPESLCRDPNFDIPDLKQDFNFGAFAGLDRLVSIGEDHPLTVRRTAEG